MRVLASLGMEYLFKPVDDYRDFKLQYLETVEPAYELMGFYRFKAQMPTLIVNGQSYGVDQIQATETIEFDNPGAAANHLGLVQNVITGQLFNVENAGTLAPQLNEMNQKTFRIPQLGAMYRGQKLVYIDGNYSFKEKKFIGILEYSKNETN